jgi:uncharacterized protein (DUF1697 family)
VPTYLALLRGINVGSHNRLGMPELTELATGLGFGDVRTHLQTGNVVFTAKQRDEAKLAERFTAAIAERWDYQVPVQLRTAAELAEVRKVSPFTGRTEKPAQLQVTFLAGSPDPAVVSTVESMAVEPDELTVLGREAYFFCPTGYGRTKLSNAFLEKKFGTLATTRNWKVVGELIDLVEG